MVRINSDHPRRDPGDRAGKGRDVQSRQLDQGPDGGPDDRGRRALRRAQARRHDHRRHVRQHRHGARDRGRDQGLQVHLHDDRQAVEGEGRRAQGVWRRRHRLPDQRRARGPALVLLGVVAPREGSAELVEGEPVRQPVELGRALRADRSRRSGTRPTGASRTSSSASAPAARSAASGRYLKERNPKIKVWGIDTYGSVFKKYKETGIFDKNEIYPYITEGIGEDFLPRNVDFSVIDHFEKVTDKDAALMTRRIAREEGIFAGNSAGSAMAGLLQLKDHFSQRRCRRRHLPRPRVALPRARCSTTTGCARRASSRRPA